MPSLAAPFHFARSFYDAMVDYWASFTRSGQPVSDGNPTWPAYADGQSWMVPGDTPRVARDVSSDHYDLIEHVICRRRAAGDQQWNWNVGLGAPVLPTDAGDCR